jgi:flagellin-like hook-associated protein FlgL
MSDNNINNSFNSSLYPKRYVDSLNKVNQGINNQNEKLSTGKSVNSAEEDSVSISKSAKLSSKVAEITQMMGSSSSGRLEEFYGESLVSLASANSTIIDTDMAKAQSESIRNKILQETTIATYAQANVEMGQVLNVLG